MPSSGATHTVPSQGTFVPSRFTTSVGSCVSLKSSSHTATPSIFFVPLRLNVNRSTSDGCMKNSAVVGTLKLRMIGPTLKRVLSSAMRRSSGSRPPGAATTLIRRSRRSDTSRPSTSTTSRYPVQPPEAPALTMANSASRLRGRRFFSSIVTFCVYFSTPTMAEVCGP